MYSRIIQLAANKSFFLFGPRGTGKSTLIREKFPDAVYIDLLESDIYLSLLASPQKLSTLIPRGHKGWVIIDEVQKVPLILDEVHRLIEKEKIKFILTGSSARKLKKSGANLLAGRALTKFLYPFVSAELQKDFRLEHALKYGCLPSVMTEEDPGGYLDSYVKTYLQEEVQQEGLTRNLGNFSRFLQAASFSQGGLLNVSEVARECAVHRKVVESYFEILQDLLLADFLPVFSRKAKRRIVQHPKFYFFDTGVYRAIRPRGPLDRPEEMEGAALETLFYQHLKALNDYSGFGTVYYWRTSNGAEVDFVLYGPKGIYAFEVKREDKVRTQSVSGLKAFLKDYPMAKGYLVYCGSRRLREDKIDVLPFEQGLSEIQMICGLK